MINTRELESLAVSPEIPILGDVASIKQMGDKLLVNVNFHDLAIAEEIEYLISSRYPSIKVEVLEKTSPKAVQPNASVKKNINNIILVSFGKSGAGQVPTAVNLALAMAANGAKVGMLDADIFHSEQVSLFKTQQEPASGDTAMLPCVVHGIEGRAVDFQSDEQHGDEHNTARIVDALLRLLNETLWGSSFITAGGTKKPYLDYLFVNISSEADDIERSLAEKIPITGAVITITSSDTELGDASRTARIFEQLDIDTLGIIENADTHGDKRHKPEGASVAYQNGKYIAEKLHLPFLGTVPFDKTSKCGSDSAQSLIVSHSEHSLSQHYRAIAQKIAIAIAHKPNNVSNAFATIAIERG